jgi:hypothetical protein
MRKIGLAIAAAVIFQVGCNLTPTVIPAGVDCGPEPTPDQVQDAINIWVRNAGLKDPSSAQIQNVRVIGRSGMYKGLVNGGGHEYGWMIEFQVNAKNSFGGYVGFRTRHVLRMPNGRAMWQMEGIGE